MKCVLAILLIMALPSVGMAQPSSRFPNSVQLAYEGSTYRAFDLGGFRELLQLDADLTAALAELDVRRSQITQLRAAIDVTNQAITDLQNNIEILRQERERLTVQWEDSDRRLQNCENKPRLAPFLAWGVAIASLAVSAGLVTYIVVDKR